MIENNEILACIDGENIYAKDYTEEEQDLMRNWDNKQWAFWAYLGKNNGNIEPISDLSIDTDDIQWGQDRYFVLTDDEADDKNYDYVESLIEQETPKYIIPYVDIQKMVDDTPRGESLAGYDGREVNFDVDGEDIYIYRN